MSREILRNSSKIAAILRIVRANWTGETSTLNKVALLPDYF
jgi:hypothetical protein